ncbi:uncharacterized protein LOC110410085 isoform X2 [Herrania umbratica]|uniref:Uncharacterized protein LOC110410085 isoform X2 n=1 Tax=Herrania umbratica TaxID=108875 RepID=A0A6J0ZME1_9ROSI|nr:uncharacterized protein LOC110410085 isoform X2 [Herrania umbratica]
MHFVYMVNYFNSGAHPSKSLKTCEETSYNIYSLREDQAGPANIEKLDYNPVLGQNPSFMPVDYLKTSVIGSSSAISEANLQAPPLNLVNCKNNHVQISTPYEKPLRQHGTTLSDSIPSVKSSPGVVIRPPAVGTSSSASNSVSFKNVNTGINATDTNLVGNNHSTVKEPRFLFNFGSKNEFDASQLSFLVDGTCYMSGESLTSTEKLSTRNMASKDASDNFFGAKSGVNLSRISPDNFSLALENNEAVMAVENSLESLDHYNPPVDSPCWKGAPASNNSPFGSSEAVAVQLVKKLEACDGSNGPVLKFISSNTANIVKHPSGKAGEILMSDENGNVENGSMSSLKLPPVSIPSFKEREPDEARKAGSHKNKASSACEIKFSDNASEWKKDYVLFDKSVDEVEKASYTGQQCLPEGRLASKNLCRSETGVADLEMKINDVMGCGSSHMSCHGVKHLSCAPSSVEDVSTKHTKFLGKEPISNSSISVLVDTMHNLSELLLYHFSNEACELREQDVKSLEKVINNLDTCMSKNIGQETLLSELHKGTSMGSPQVAAIDVLSQHAQAKRKHFGKKDEKCSDFVSVRSGPDIKVKNDKMTQVIKKVLIENFHEKEEAHPQVLLYKNLWLEAEAALCSINYMARYNNMKIEIEKCKLDTEKDLSEDTPDEDKISRSKLSADLNTNKKLTAIAESAPTPDVSNQNFPIASSSNHADDVTARFHVSKHRLNNSNSVHTRDADELSSSKLSLDTDAIDKLATEVKDSSTSSLRTQDSPAPGTACHTDDVEASIMARLHILKSRGIVDLDSNEMEQKPLPEVVDLGFAGKKMQIPIDEDTADDQISGFNLESVSQNQVVDYAGEQLVVKDFHPCVKHDCTIQSPKSARLGNQLSAGWYDSCSSDWEHVLKEELSGQNS